MDAINEADLRLIEEVPGRAKLKALLSARGMTLTEFASRRNHWVTDVSNCLAGRDGFPAIRESLSVELDLPRSEIDRLIDTPTPSPTTESAA